MQAETKARGVPAARRAPFAPPAKSSNLWLGREAADLSSWDLAEDLLKLAGSPSPDSPGIRAPNCRLDDWVNTRALQALVLLGKSLLEDNNSMEPENPPITESSGSGNPKSGKAAGVVVQMVERSWGGVLASLLPLSLVGALHFVVWPQP